MSNEYLDAYGVYQLEGETNKAFQAFTAYLMMPIGERSLSKLKNDPDITESVHHWCKNHRWVQRAREFDNAVASGALMELIGRRQNLVVEVLTNAITDARLLRTQLMKGVGNAKVDQMERIIPARVELDSWMAQVIEMMHAIGGDDAET